MKTRQSFRNTDFEVVKNEEGKKYVEGYFIVYDQEIELFAGVYEEISREAVSNSLADKDIRALFNHNNDIVLGRTGNNTLELTSDEVGLFGRIEINQGDKQAVDIMARIERQDINACSFGFYPLKEEIEEREDGSVKFTVKDMDLIEVSPVAFPAYPTTSISARSKDVAEYKKKKRELRKIVLLERLQNKEGK